MKNYRRDIIIGVTIIMCFTLFISCTPSSTEGETSSPLLEVPPVFDNINSFHDQSFFTINLPAIYRNINKSDEPQGWSVELISKFTFPSIPTVLNTFSIIRPNVDEEYARKIAKQVGFNEPIQEKSQTWPFHQSRYFYIPASDPTERYPLEIFQDGSIAIHFNDSPWIGNIPSNQECIDIAREWLKSHNLYPTGILDIQTSPTITHAMIGREEREYTIATTVSFKMIIDGYELLKMGAYVSVGDNREICEVYINAPKLERYSAANIKDPGLAFDTLRDYLREPSKFYTYSPECLINNIERNMTINEVSLKYFPMLSEDFDQPVYAQPIYVFKGQAYPESSSAYSFVARVDAVAR